MSSQNSPFFIRMASPDDAEECHEIDVEAWGEESAATVEMLLARISAYPLGNFVAVDRQTGQIVGSVWTVATAEKPITTWWETSGEGAYSAVCNPYGDLLVGINVSVRPPYLGRNVGEILVIRAGEVAWAMGKRKAVLGSRIPEYHKWRDVFEAKDYIHLKLDALGTHVYYHDAASGNLHQGPMKADLRAVADGEKIDPHGWPVIGKAADFTLRGFDGELAYFLDIRIAGQRCRLFQLLPGYFPDPDSCDNGVLIGWENETHPDFKG